MSLSHFFLTALLLSPWTLAAAQPADPSDPQAGTALQYQSTFENYRRYAEPAQTPDKSWREANRQVGELKGHAGHLAPDPRAVPPSAAAAAKPGPAPREAPQGSGARGGHHAHH